MQLTTAVKLALMEHCCVPTAGDFSSPVIKRIAGAHSVSVAQVCLRWVLQRGCVMAVGTGSDAEKAAEYAKEDLNLYGFELTATEMKTLNAMK